MAPFTARAEGKAFEETATRIRSIAAIHRLLAETRGRDIVAGQILSAIAAGAPVPVAVHADQTRLSAEVAQQVGIVANELIDNAVRHGEPPLTVRFSVGPPARLQVDDGGRHLNGQPYGLGLQLVSQVVEHGLHGSFRLAPKPDGGARAEVTFELQCAS
jgi:two-component sensor histidine kinase